MWLRLYERMKPQALPSFTTLFKCNLTLTLDLLGANTSLLSLWHHSCPLTNQSCFTNRLQAQNTSAHWRSCGCVIKWDAIAEWISKEQKGSWRRHHKQALEVVAWGCFSVLGGNVSGGDRSAMRERSEAKKQRLERELPCYPVRLKCIRLIGFQSEMQDTFRVSRPTQKLYVSPSVAPKKNIRNIHTASL